jgi:cation transport ATPase
VLASLIVDIIVSLRRGEVGLDIVAALPMTAAMAFGETLAAVAAMMHAGGNLPEAYAARRARKEMSALLSPVPRAASRRVNGGLEEVSLDAVIPGDVLLMRRGDVARVDAEVCEGVAILDQPALTGEAMPVRRAKGAPVMSGSSNAGDAFYLRATRLGAQSAYAGIMRLVEDAQRSKAPMARLADRYAIWCLFLTLAIAGAARGSDRRSDSRGGGAGDRDAVPADPRGAGGADLAPVAGGEIRRANQGRPCACGNGPRARHRHGQDRDPGRRAPGDVEHASERGHPGG